MQLLQLADVHRKDKLKSHTNKLCELEKGRVVNPDALVEPFPYASLANPMHCIALLGPKLAAITAVSRCI